MMYIEDLRIEAREKYPIGSQFVDLVHQETFTVKSHDSLTYYPENKSLYIPVEQNNRSNSTARIYKSGKWAVVNTPIINNYEVF